MNFKEFLYEEAIRYNIENGIPLDECIYRRGTPEFYGYYEYLREKYSSSIESNIGLKGIFEGKEVPLDLPFIDMSESEPELNVSKRGGPKKFYVYVKNDKGSVVKVSFGDPCLNVKFSDPEARKSFVARHNCADKKDKTTPGYWSCNLPKYAKYLGLSDGGNFFW